MLLWMIDPTAELRKFKLKALHIQYVKDLVLTLQIILLRCIAGWSSGQETKELKASLEVIRETASDIIEKIEEKMPELAQERKVVKQADRPFDLHKTVDYISGIASKIAIAENDDLGQKTFEIALNNSVDLAVFPTEEVGLKDLCEFVSTSENLESMQERVNEVMNFLGYELV